MTAGEQVLLPFIISLRSFTCSPAPLLSCSIRLRRIVRGGVEPGHRGAAVVAATYQIAMLPLQHRTDVEPNEHGRRASAERSAVVLAYHTFHYRLPCGPRPWPVLSCYPRSRAPKAREAPFHFLPVFISQFQ